VLVEEQMLRVLVVRGEKVALVAVEVAEELEPLAVEVAMEEMDL
jgi:hypothetical protein